jgi:DNA-binding transcriptional ArsR family regulator
MVPLSKGAVSDHLNRLRSAGFVIVECQGRFNYYTLNIEVLREAALATEAFFQALERDALPSRASGLDSLMKNV